MGQIEKNYNIAIIGPGGIGGLISSLFFKYGFNIYCLGNYKNKDSRRIDNLFLQSPYYGSFKFLPRDYFDLKITTKFDFVFITVKTPKLEEALQMYSKFFDKDTVIVSLMNGLWDKKVIFEYCKSKLVIGTIGAIEVKREKNLILHNSLIKPEIEIAPYNSFNNVSMIGLQKLIEKIDINCTVFDNYKDVIWRKLVRLSPISTMTSITQKSIGYVLSETENRKILEGLVLEICKIAKTEGVFISTEEVINQILKLPKNLETSMQRDLKKKKISELDSILISPIHLGQKKSLSLPNMNYCLLEINKKYNLCQNYLNIENS